MEFAICHLIVIQCSISYIHCSWGRLQPHNTFSYYKIDDDDDQICEIQLRIQLLPIHQRTNPRAKTINV